MDSSEQRDFPRPFSRQIAGWFNPWKEIAAHPGPLVFWLVITLVAGSVGFWLTPLLGMDRWLSIVGLSSLGSFCIVMLVEAHQGILLSILLTGRSLRDAEGGRLIAMAIAAILLVIQAALVVALRGADENCLGSLPGLQLVIVGLSTVTAVYLLCFRLQELDPSAGALQAREDRVVNQLAEGAASISKTEEGEEL